MSAAAYSEAMNQSGTWASGNELALLGELYRVNVTIVMRDAEVAAHHDPEIGDEQTLYVFYESSHYSLLVPRPASTSSD